MDSMDKDATRKELEERLGRYLKAVLKQAGLTYEELAEKLREYGFNEETKASVASKLGRGSFPASFLVAVLRVAGKEGVALRDIG